MYIRKKEKRHTSCSIWPAFLLLLPVLLLYCCTAAATVCTYLLAPYLTLFCVPYPTSTTAAAVPSVYYWGIRRWHTLLLWLKCCCVRCISLTWTTSLLDENMASTPGAPATTAARAHAAAATTLEALHRLDNGIMTNQQYSAAAVVPWAGRSFRVRYFCSTEPDTIKQEWCLLLCYRSYTLQLFV